MKWLDLNWPELAVLPYFAAIWAFNTYVGVVATPWTMSWIIPWLIFSPAVAWSGVFIFGGAWWLTTACFVALIVAIPFWADAIWMLVTLFVMLILGALPHVWM